MPHYSLSQRGPRSREHLIALLHAAGFPDPHATIASKQAEFRLASIRPYNLRRHIEAAAIAASLTEIVISYLMLILYRRPDLTEDRHRAAVTVAGLIHTDLRSIIILCATGYDSQARNILRSTRERLDVFGCCALSNGFSRAFMAADTPELANEFWHKKIRGKKARNFYADSFKAWTGDETNLHDVWSDWRTDVDLMLNTAEHVYHVAGFSAIFPASGSRKDQLGLDGLPAKRSLWTIQTCVFFIWEMLMSCRVAFSDLRDGKFDAENDSDVALADEIKRIYPQYSEFTMLLCHTYIGNGRP